ncbi:MAG: hypothetical protein KIT80_07565 [Chitinophagaceae bacterium]|nr:hypothetical protein [Chitinophagaceae bacterium]MCW5926750.1 hypothetical protein [Chitinophagaceae bacterium]
MIAKKLRLFLLVIVLPAVLILMAGYMNKTNTCPEKQDGATKECSQCGKHCSGHSDVPENKTATR